MREAVIAGVTAAVWLIAAGGAAEAQAPTAAPRWEVSVTLSPAAAKKLAAGKEEIVLSAAYYGEPTKAAAKKADEIGQIDLGQEELRLGSAGGRVVFVGKGFKADRLGWVVGREARVNLNVYSARKSSPDNLLDCELFEDTMAVAQAKPVAIACKLIGER